LEVKEITTKTLRKNPDTGNNMSDEQLTGAMKAIQKAKLKIPDDITVITISNGYLPKLYYQEITCVETSGFKLGKPVFPNMMVCIAGVKFIQELTIESLLVKGGSIQVIPFRTVFH
jgi:LacI family transcriptional regulator